MIVKEVNPKDAVAGNKVQMHLVPDSLKVNAALSFTEGALKYGAYNWRKTPVKASVYRSAADRHLAKWWNGEQVDPETGVPHLASVIACCAILLDAGLVGTLIDDRPPQAPVGSLMNEQEGQVAHLKELFKGYDPHHYTIEDN